LRERWNGGRATASRPARRAGSRPRPVIGPWTSCAAARSARPSCGRRPGGRAVVARAADRRLRVVRAQQRPEHELRHPRHEQRHRRLGHPAARPASRAGSSPTPAPATRAGSQVQVTGLSPLTTQGASRNGPSVLDEILLGALGALAVLAFVFASLMAAGSAADRACVGDHRVPGRRGRVPEGDRDRGPAGMVSDGVPVGRGRLCWPCEGDGAGAADIALFGHRHERPEQPQIHIDVYSATLSTESECVLDGPPAGGPDFRNAPASPSREPAARGTTRMGQAIRLRRRPPGMTRRYQAGCAAALPRKAACRTRHGWRLRS
jgi:hypothetical protein